MTKKGYQPEYIYGKPNPNYSGPEKAKEISDEIIQSLKDLTFNNDFDEDEDYEFEMENIRQQKEITMDNQVVAYVMNNNLKDYVKFEYQGYEYGAGEFPMHYAYYHEGNPSDDVFEDIDDWKVNITTNGHGDVTDEVNERALKKMIQDNGEDSLPNVTIMNGCVQVPASYILDNPDKSGLSPNQQNNVSEMFSTIGDIHTHGLCISDSEYKSVQEKRVQKGYDETKEDISRYINDMALSKSYDHLSQKGEINGDLSGVVETYKKYNSYLQDKILNDEGVKKSIINKYTSRVNQENGIPGEQRFEFDDFYDIINKNIDKHTIQDMEDNK